MARATKYVNVHLYLLNWLRVFFIYIYHDLLKNCNRRAWKILNVIYGYSLWILAAPKNACKTSLQKEKSLVPRKFSFFKNAFNSHVLLNVKRVTEWGKSENLDWWYLFWTLINTDIFFLLPLSHAINFRLFQTERVCRRQFLIWWKWRKVLKTGRKHSGKRRNCS